ncbi:quinone-reactive Ni/Fe-hydrogenase small chain [Nautilia profundicola AmH]|uniref:Quinone-reactive Ni/Fe-hydrogenase small chain n=1 Tax=Nautilia profundicola (strain ATCC BAA-1463 / DSM 18972 / AmH) TaxID=598659 RepID=B9L8N2_NAUPA|nr:hydrogenase small subunit [Nautilia profundicola]ACM93009.1 quinone-reactive Ni/Fe-hydrogenase small chain [Nautilia profundicola AmH]
MNEATLQKVKERIEALKKLPGMGEKSVSKMLEDSGFTRRDFLKWSAAMAAMLSLPTSFTPLIAEAAEVSDRLPVIWLNMAECTGCSESLIRSDAPTIDNLIFNYINLQYHDTIMAAAGWQAEENLKEGMEKFKGRYILCVEGGIPTNMDGQYLTMGPHAETGLELLTRAANDAAAVISVGTCSSFGGIQAAAPNPTGAKGVYQVINKPVINVPGCPPSAKNIVGTILYVILFGALPAVDNFNRPKFAYGLRIHDLCERRGHFDAGEFVEQFGDAGAENGFCLYKVGCKGPYTFNNCSRERFNQHTSWPVQAGHGCIGCSEPDFWDSMAPYEEPLANKKYDSPLADATADSYGVTILTVAGVAIAAHAALSAIKNPKE